MAEHKYAEVLRAIADGKPVEVRTRGYDDYGNVQSTWGAWKPMDVSGNFSIFSDSGVIEHRVKPKEKVKKWRWVARYVESDADMIVTAAHYKDEAEFHKTESHKNYVFVAPVPGTMIEVDE